MQLHRLAFLFGATSLLLVGAYACGGDDDSGTTPGTDAGTDTGTTPTDSGSTENPDTGSTEPTDSGSDAGDAGIPELCIGNPLSADGGTYAVTLDGGASTFFTVLPGQSFTYGPQYVDELGGQLVYSATADHTIARTSPDGGGIVNEITELPDASYDTVGSDYYQGAVYTLVAQENAGGGLLYKYALDAGTGSIVLRFPPTKIVSPNNIAITSQGIAYVTDPAFQFTPPAGKVTGVYSMFLDGGSLDGGAALGEFAADGQPVGIALNQDQSRLYVSFSGGSVEYFTVANGLANTTAPAGSWTTKAGYTASGIAIDRAGNVWVAEQKIDRSSGLIEVYNAAGSKLWATINLPSSYLPNGIAFGNTDRTRVFVTTENDNGSTPILSLSTRCPGTL